MFHSTRFIFEFFFLTVGQDYCPHGSQWLWPPQHS